MAIYSKRYNYLFIASPQTGSKTIAKTLRERLEGQQLPEQDVKKNGQVVVKKHHCTLRSLVNQGQLSAEAAQSAFKFSGVRNPYDLLVSRYLKLRGRFAEGGDKARYAQRDPRKAEAVALASQLDFPQWVAQANREALARQEPLRGPMSFIEGCDFVIRFESLQPDFDEALRRIGISPTMALPQHNVTAERLDGTQKRDYRSYYDEAAIAQVAMLYAPVIAQFNYRFDGTPETCS